MNEARESRLADNAKVTLRVNAVVKTGRTRRAIAAAPRLCNNPLKCSI